MSLKDIFNAEKKRKNNLTTVNFQNLSSLNRDSIEVESVGFIEKANEDFKRFIPPVDYSTASNFAKFGLAERYYEESISRVTNLYPFDGSLKEKKEWRNGSTAIDLYIFDYEYPKATGFVNFASGGWGSRTGGTTNLFGNPNTKEYISFFNRAVGNVVENVYDVYAERRENTRFIFSTGSTIEFWLKKNSFTDFATQTPREAIFYTATTGSDNKEKRFMIFLDNSETGSIYSLYNSNFGSNTEFSFKYDLDSGNIADSQWHHYAFTFYHSGSNYYSEFYFDGVYKGTQSFNVFPAADITGSAFCTLGALGGGVFGTQNLLGWGKLSGSIDEFRFWNTRKNAKDIGRYYITSEIGDGTNTDDANTDLGIHFKFNEGITTDSAVDVRVLDYSGRANDGTFTGYSSSSRSTGSAIDEAGFSEPKDPIIYADNPTLISYKETKMGEGRTYDYSNAGSLYKKFPAFMLDEDSQNGFVLRNLTQIMASYLDKLYLQIQFLPKLKQIEYTTQDSRPHNFYAKALESAGFPSVDIFADIDAFNRYLSRDEKQLFEKDFELIKNRILQNIYNNLPLILKSKGTEKSFRNFIRCFGVDDEIYKLNLYSDNSEYIIQNRYKNSTVSKNYINFNQLYNTDAVVYSYPDASNANSVGFVSGTFDTIKLEENISNTYEIDVVFPEKPPLDDPLHVEYSALSSSIFGVVAANASSPTDTTIPANNLSNLELYVVRPESLSRNAYFVLKSSYSSSTAADNFTIQTNTIKELYTDQRWNFAVRISPQGYDISDLASPSSPTNYLLELYGVSVVGDYKVQEITASTTIGYDRGLALLSKPRRLYVGSTRTNVTGALLVGSDIKVSSTKLWFDYLDNDTVYNNAIQGNVDGNELPYKSAYLGQTQLSGTFIPKIDTLALNWSFNQVYSSSAGGQFTVIDNSSGSSASGTNRYGTLGGIIKAQHTARGDEFAASAKIISKEFLAVLGKKLPEQISTDDTVQVLTQDDLVFTKESRPIRTFISIERSMYQTISEEMLKLMSSINQFSNLVGERQNQYRHEYKDMGKLRSLFFESIGNTPDLDKYVEYYKWLDVNLNRVIENIFPASADTSEEVSRMVESHVLERSKYKWKFPTMEFKALQPEAGLIGINKHLYNWKYGHAPIPLQETTSSLWWNKRAERSGLVLSSSNASVNTDKNVILSASYQVLNRSFTTPVRYAVDESKQYIGGSNIKNKKFDYYKPSRSDINVFVERSPIAPDTSDASDLVSKYDAQSVYAADDKKFRFLTPFSYYQDKRAVASSTQVISTNHLDVYGPHYEVPMQGPFTEKYVGGNAYRHQQLFSSGSGRAEAYILSGAYDNRIIRNPFNHNPTLARSDFFREELAKRPVNIKNIAQTTGSTIIGNYDKKYQYLQTSDRNVNNPFFTRNGGISSTGRVDPYVSGSNVWVLPNRTRTETVFVERFSSPGDPLTMNEGALDVKSAQYSVYNALPFRNLNIRNALKTFLTTPSSFGGYESGSSVTASFHKVPKNSYSNVAGTANKDNFWIQHPVPQCDLNYSWINDSAASSSTCDNITFTSASSISKTDGTTLVQPVVYTDSNFYIIDPINTASSLLGLDNTSINSYINSNNGYYTLSNERAFAALITKRNAGYGYPTWRQIRTGQAPLAKYLRDNNILPITSEVKIPVSNLTRNLNLPISTYDEVVNYTETPITVNYPVKYKFITSNYSNGTKKDATIPLTITHLNNVSFFHNTALNDKFINFEKLPKQTYDNLQQFIKNKDSLNPIKSVEEFKYTVKLFPRKVNTYLAKVRGRTEYTQTTIQLINQDVIARRTFWRDSLIDRTRILGSKNSQGNDSYVQYFDSGLGTTVQSQLKSSIFQLDSDYDSDTYGELAKKTYFIDHPDNAEYSYYLTASAVYSAVNNVTYNRLINDTFTNSGINPWYDSYEDFSSDIKTIGKDYSIIPEFRISDHMQYFVAGNDLNFNSKQLENFLRLDGVPVSASNQTDFYKIYSHTDFITNFAEFENDLNNTGINKDNKTIRIKMSAIKKLLPYNGFYPSARLLQMAQLFSSSFSGTTTGGFITADYGMFSSTTGVSNYAPFFSLFFSPGVIFNTIKSGIAVDFPAHTGSVTGSNLSYGSGFFGVNLAPDYRIKFESCITPNKTNLKTNQSIGFPANGGLFVSSSWSGQKNNSLYELSANNFFGESIKFFLNGESTQVFASSKESDFEILDKNKTYYLNVTLYKRNCVTYESSVSFYGGPYGSAYSSSAVGADDPSYAPSTPPYFYGDSSVQLSFKPPETRKYKLSEIFAGLTSSYSNSFDNASGVDMTKFTSSAAYFGTMRIDASVNLQGSTILKQVVYDKDSKPFQIYDQSSGEGYDTWVISPKFETPIFDYSSYKQQWVLSNPFDNRQFGMWVNFKDTQGSDNQGIFLEISDPFPEKTNKNDPTTGSLITACKFSTSDSVKKLGKLADTREISEAIVAIPIDRNGNRYSIPADTFKLLQNPDLENAAKPFNPKPSRALQDMYERMQKYVFPPHLDFINNNSVKPFGMYIFEFTHTLSKLDLAKIWQGVMPEIATKAELDEQIIEHGFSEGDIFNNKFDPETKWIVFKVKRKAENSYYNAVAGASQDTRFDFSFKIGNQTVSAKKSILPYSYNWPYDFFSLVELAKIDAEVTYKKKK